MNKEEQSQAESSAPSIKAKIERPPTVWQGACHTEKTDEWFQIGLSNLEVAALKLAQERVWALPDCRVLRAIDSDFATDTTSATVRVLLVGALAHFDVLLPLLLKDAESMRQRGCISISVFLDELIKRRCLAEMAAEGARK
jgi:hypothetical protein